MFTLEKYRKWQTFAAFVLFATYNNPKVPMEVKTQVSKLLDETANYLQKALEVSPENEILRKDFVNAAKKPFTEARILLSLFGMGTKA